MAESKLIKCVPPSYGGSVTIYNDSPRTTHEDIMALFDCAIKGASK